MGYIITAGSAVVVAILGFYVILAFVSNLLMAIRNDDADEISKCKLHLVLSIVIFVVLIVFGVKLFMWWIPSASN